MSKFAFSSLFSADAIASSFDHSIEQDAANGRVNAAFTTMLDGAYGVVIPASPAKAVQAVNAWLTLPKAPRIAQGPGARAAAPAVAQGLRALALALHASDRCKGLPMLAALPVWADPEAIAKAKATSTAKRAATVEAKTSTATAAPAVEAAPKAAPLPTAAETRASAVNVVVSALQGGHLSQAQIDALRAALETAQPAASKVGTTRTKPAKVRTVSVPTVAPAVALGSVNDALARAQGHADSAAMALLDGAGVADAVASMGGVGVAVGQDAPALAH